MNVSHRAPGRFAPVLWIFVLLALAGCTVAPATFSATPAATTTVPTTPSPTAPPTATPEPTATRPPTRTPLPSNTPPPTATRAPKHITETENYLLLGMDQRPGEGAWRTDTIMVAAVDYDSNQIGIVSIPRDLWVDIPGYGMGRINQADFIGEEQKYPGGGPALAAKVIQDTLGIPTGNWVRIKQEGLVELVDALGGVEVTLDCPLHELTPDPAKADAYLTFDLPAGKVFLDGPTAKKFVTYRYNSNDFYRAKRQQQVIWAIRERALQIDAIPKIPELWRTLAKTFTTDLSVLDVVRLARLGAGLNADQVHGVVFSTDAIEYAVVAGGAQVLQIKDKDQLQKELSGLFASTSISQQGREGSNALCATPTPPVTATPAATATHAVPWTSTPTAAPTVG